MALLHAVDDGCTVAEAHLSRLTESSRLAVFGVHTALSTSAIDRQAISCVDAFSMQNCANIVWGFAKLNYKVLAESEYDVGVEHFVHVRQRWRQP